MQYVFILVAIIVTLTGCAAVDISCKGKGTLVGQGMGYGGSITGDCGDGFEYHRNSVPLTVK